MKYLLHGDDIVASRNFLSQIIDGKNVTTFDGKILTLSQIKTICSIDSLFDNNKLILIEGLYSTNPAKKEILAFLNTYNGNSDLVLLEDKKIPKNSLQVISNFEKKEFLLPIFYFDFLDSLTPQYKQKELDLYHKLLTNYAPEQLLFSLLKRARLLLMSYTGESNEFLQMPDWIRSKIRKQAQLWNKKSLFVFYKRLQDTEIGLKTGKIPVDLSKQLDIVLLSHL